MANGTQDLETIVGTGVEPRQTCLDARLAATTDVLVCSELYWIRPVMFCSLNNIQKLEMWASAQRDGRPAEYRWRPLFNAAKFG